MCVMIILIAVPVEVDKDLLKVLVRIGAPGVIVLGNEMDTWLVRSGGIRAPPELVLVPVPGILGFVVLVCIGVGSGSGMEVRRFSVLKVVKLDGEAVDGKDAEVSGKDKVVLLNSGELVEGGADVVELLRLVEVVIGSDVAVDPVVVMKVVTVALEVVPVIETVLVVGEVLELDIEVAVVLEVLETDVTVEEIVELVDTTGHAAIKDPDTGSKYSVFKPNSSAPGLAGPFADLNATDGPFGCPSSSIPLLSTPSAATPG